MAIKKKKTHQHQLRTTKDIKSGEGHVAGNSGRLRKEKLEDAKLIYMIYIYKILKNKQK